jgi:hypothetical protein
VLVFVALMKRDVVKFQDEVRSQDTVFFIASVAMNKHGRELAWNFVKKNWQELMNRYEVRNSLVCTKLSVFNAFAWFCRTPILSR